jgi:hypothetical protein
MTERLLWTLQTLPAGQPPEIKRTRNAKVVMNASAGVLRHGRGGCQQHGDSLQSFLLKAHRKFWFRMPGAIILPQMLKSVRKSSIGSVRRSGSSCSPAHEPAPRKSASNMPSIGKPDTDYLSLEDFRLYQDMKRWHVDVGNMLSYINDVLTPHGFDEIVKDDFAALRQMLFTPSLTSGDVVAEGNTRLSTVLNQSKPD